jgi:hypothetical protein
MSKPTKKVLLSGLASDTSSPRYKRSMKAIVEGRKKKSNKIYTSKQRARILKEFRDGWFGKE